MKFTKKKLIAALVASLITTLITGAFLFLEGSPTETLRLGLTDRLYLEQVNSGEKTPSDDIVIIAIDDQTLTDPRFGRWQDWRRTNFANLLNRLAKEDTAAIGIDVTFSEPSKNPSDDIALANAIGNAGNVALVGRADATTGALFPIDIFKDKTLGLGFANLDVDSDNVVRSSPKYINFGSKEKEFALESFAMQIAQIANPAISVEQIPEDTAGNFLINFFSRPHGYQYISFDDAIDGNFGKINLKNKIVLVGVTPADLRDLEPVPTSFGVKMPGIEIHANAIQTILEQDFLLKQGKSSTFLIIFVMAVVSGIIFIMLGVIPSLIILLVSIFGYSIATQYFFEQRLVLDVIHPPLVLILTFIGVYLYRFIFADRDKRHLKTAFGHYVASSLVDKIVDNPDALKLGGEKRELTIFFSDLAGFTSISEKLTPEELVKLLNAYLGEMTDIIMESDGTLDKYIGDAVMAFWNAPLPKEDHAVAACLAALTQQESLAKLKTELDLPKDIELRARMGINTDDVVVGNMGSTNRFNYTVMGDGVNLASRLEGVNKAYETLIIISEATYKVAKKAIEARELDTIRVKGKEEGIKIYELVSKKGALASKQEEAYIKFAEGLATYRIQDWDRAERYFKEIQKILPEDGPTKAFLKRIEEYKKNPPPKDWGGIYTMTTK